MKDPETGLTDKTLKAIQLYNSKYLEQQNSKYTFNDAMIEAGYGKGYAKSHAAKIVRNSVVSGLIDKKRQEIANRDAKRAENQELKREEMVAGIQYGLDTSKNKGNLVAYRGFLELGCRALGMLTDNINTTDTQKQQELDEKGREEAAAFARWRLEQKYKVKGA